MAVAPEDADQAEQKTLRIFRVQGKLLALPLIYFETMVHISAGTKPPADLPELRKEESVAVIKVILGAAYNNSRLVEDFVQCKD